MEKFTISRQEVEDALQTEAVEICPYCEQENYYPNWDTEKEGFIAKCSNCGKEIFLCDECLHAVDNPKLICDWNEGKCFRGYIPQ